MANLPGDTAVPNAPDLLKAAIEKKNSTRGVRNNNWFNIEQGASSPFQGQVAANERSGGEDRFGQFQDDYSGNRAAGVIMRTYRDKYNLRTPKEIRSRWAPDGENDGSAYDNFIAQKTGLDPNQPLSDEDYPKVMQAMAQFESGVEAPLETFQMAWNEQRPSTVAPVTQKQQQVAEVTDQKSYDLQAKTSEKQATIDPTAVQPEQPEVAPTAATNPKVSLIKDAGELGLLDFIGKHRGKATDRELTDFYSQVSAANVQAEIAQKSKQVVNNWELLTPTGQLTNNGLALIDSILRVGTGTAAIPFALTGDDETAGTIVNAGKVLSDRVNQSQVAFAAKEAERSWRKNAPLLKQGTSAIEQGNYLEGGKALISGLGSLVAEGGGILLDNPGAVGQTVAASLPDVAMAGRSLIVAGASIYSRNQTEAIEEYVAKNGNVPEGDVLAKMRWYNGAGAVIASFSDKITGQAGRVFKKTPAKVSPAEVKSNLLKSVAKPVTPGFKGAGSEYLAENAENQLQQMSVVQDYAEVDAAEGHGGGVLGAGGGATISSGVALAQASKEGAAKAVVAAEQNKQKKAAIQDAIENPPPVQPTAPTEAPIPTVDSSDPVQAVQILQQRNKQEGTSQETKRANLKEAAYLVNEAMIRMETALEKAEKGKASEKEIKQAIEEYKELATAFAAAKESVYGAKEVAAIVNTVTAAEANTPKVQDAVKELYHSAAQGSLSDEQLDQVISNKNGFLGSQDLEQFSAIKATRVAMSKLTSEVNKDVLEGGDGYLGLAEHMDIIQTAITAGNMDTAQKQLDNLTAFAKRHAAKNKAIQSAWQTVQAGESLTEAQRQALAPFKTTAGGPLFVDKRSSALATNVANESAALTAGVKQMRQALARAKGAPVSNQASQPVSQATSEIDTSSTEKAAALAEQAAYANGALRSKKKPQPAQEKPAEQVTDTATDESLFEETGTLHREMLAEKEPGKRADIKRMRDIRVKQLTARGHSSQTIRERLGITQKPAAKAAKTETTAQPNTRVVPATDSRPGFISDPGLEREKRLAKTNRKNKTISLKPGITVSEFFNYFTGKVASKTSKQKQLVLEKLAEKGYPLDYLKKVINTDAKAKLLILWHEQAHVLDDTLDTYFEGDTVPPSYVTAKQIQIETDATLFALEKMRVPPVDKASVKVPSISGDAELDQLMVQFPKEKATYHAKKTLSEKGKLTKKQIKRVKDSLLAKQAAAKTAPKQGAGEAVSVAAPVAETGQPPKDYNLTEDILSQEEALPKPTDPAEYAGWLQSVNWVTQFFKGRKARKDDASSNALVTVPDLFARLRQDSSLVAEFLGAAPSPKQQTNLDKLLAFEQTMVAVFDSLVDTSKNRKFRHEDMLQYLADKEGNFNPNVKSALAVVAYNWVATMATGTVRNNEDAIKRILGLSDTQQLPMGAYNILGKVGVDKNTLVASLGKDVARTLELKATEEAAANMEGNLHNALGTMVVAMLSDQGYIERTAVTYKEWGQLTQVNWDRVASDQKRSDLDNLRMGLMEDAENGIVSEYVNQLLDQEQLPVTDLKQATFAQVIRGEYVHIIRLDNGQRIRTNKYVKGLDEGVSAVTHFFRIPTQEAMVDGKLRILISNQLDEIVNANKEVDGMLAKLFQVQSGFIYPSFEQPKPPKSVVPRKMKGTEQTIALEQEEALQTHGARPHQLKERNHKVYSFFDKANQLLLAGYVADVENTIHVKNQKQVESKNADIERTLWHYENLVNILPEGLATPLYFEHEVWRQGRIGMKGPLSIQGNKVMRGLIGMASSKKTRSTDKNSADYKEFLLALGAAWDQDIDKHLFEVTYPKVETLIASKTVKDAVAAIQRVLNNEGTPQDQKAIMQAVAKLNPDEGMHAIEGLVNLAAYQETVKQKQATFETDLSIEVDGITNGPIMGLIQLAVAGNWSELLQRLQKGGIYQKGGPRSFPEWKANGGKLDAYEELGKVWADLLEKGIEASSEHLQKRLRAAQAIMGTPGRSEAKSPLMTMVYGAGIAASAENVGTAFLETVYNQIQEAVAENDWTLLDELSQQVNTMAGREVLSFDKATPIKDALAVEMDYAAERQLSDLVSNSFGKVLVEAITQKYGNFRESAKMVNDNISIVADIHRNLYNAMVEAERNKMIERGEIVNVQGTPINTLTKAQLATIEARIYKALPILNTVFSKSTGDIRNGIQINEKGKEPGNHPEYKQRTNFSKTLHFLDGDAKSMSTRSAKTTFLDTGVRPTVMSIHSMDAAVMLRLLAKMEAVNVHDAIILAQGDTQAGAKLINKLFLEVMQEISIPEESQVTLERAVDLYEEMQQELPGLISLDQLIKNKNIRKHDDKEMKFTTYGEYHRTMAKRVKQAVETKNIALSQAGLIINQYGWQTGEHEQTDTATESVQGDLFAAMNQAQAVAGDIDQTITNKEVPLPKPVTPRAVTEAVNPVEDTAIKVGSVVQYDKDGKYYVVKRVSESGRVGLINAEGKSVPGTPLLNKLHFVKHLPTTEYNGMIYIVDAKNDRLYTAKGEVFKDKTNPQRQAIMEGELSFSSTTTLDPTQFTDPAKLVDSMNLLEVFDDINDGGVIAEDPQHAAYLRDFMGSVVKQVMQPFKLYTRSDSSTETVGATNGLDMYIQHQVAGTAPQISGILANGIRMSAQEVMAHESAHNIFMSYIGKGSKYTRELQHLYDLAAKHITPVDFMADPAMDKADPNYAVELEAATQRWNHIFNPTSTVKERSTHTLDYTYKEATSNHLQEFAAFGVTNKRFMELLASAKVNDRPKVMAWHEGKNIQEILQSMLSAAMSWIQQNLLHKSPNETLDKQLQSLLQQMVGVESRSKVKWLQQVSGAAVYTSKTLNKMIDLGKTGLFKLTGSNMVKNNRIKAVSVAGRLTNLALSGTPTPFKEVLNKTAKIFQGYKYGWVQNTLNEMKGRTDSNGKFHDYLRMANHTIDQARKQTELAVRNVANELYTTPLESADKVALGKAVLKTDLVSLVGTYNLNQMQDLMNVDNVALEAEIDNHEQTLALNYTANQHFYSRAAESLGHAMATGVALESHHLMNAHNIAFLGGNLPGHPSPPEAEALAAMEVIDRLATLYAIKYTSHKHRTATAEIIKREMAVNPDENGFLATLSMHKDLQEDALAKLFQGKPTLMIKGYTKEIVNPHTSLVVAPANREAELLRQGYVKRSAPLARDPSDPVQDELFIYISKSGALNTHSAGIMSISNNKAKGANSIDILMQLQDPNAVQAGVNNNTTLLQVKQQAALDMFQPRPTTVPSQRKPNLMVPIIAPNGDVHAYRYMMSEQVKDQWLEKHNDFDAVMGAMASQVVDKVAGREMNEKAVEALYDEYQTDYSTNGRAYVSISPRSTDPKLREIWKMIPYDAKQHVKQVWGREEMLVRKDLVELVFGQRKISVMDLFMAEPAELSQLQTLFVKMATALLGEGAGRKLRVGEDVLKALTKEVKDFIVVKSGTVTLANTVSNWLFLKMRGVSITDAVKDQIEALNSATAYQKDKAALDKLLIKEKIKSTPEGQRQIVMLRNAIAINPINELIEAGIMQSIVEDIAQDEDLYSYKSSLDKTIDSKLDWVPGIVKQAGRQLYMAHDTKAYKVLNNAVRMSDFVARYALYKHLTKQGMSKEAALGDIVNAFINYDLPTHRLTQYLNDTGFWWFSKYAFRIQKVIMDTLIKHPGEALSVFLLQGIFGDAPDIVESLGDLNRAGATVTNVEALGDALSVHAVSTLSPF